jgi:hypothetical protein
MLPVARNFYYLVASILMLLRLAEILGGKQNSSSWRHRIWLGPWSVPRRLSGTWSGIHRRASSFLASVSVEASTEYCVVQKDIILLGMVELEYKKTVVD